MKKIIISLLFFGLTLLPFSCKWQKQPGACESHKGDTLDITGDYTPVTIVWVKKDTRNEWAMYKCFTSIDEMQEIRNGLIDPEESKYNSAFIGDYYLVASYVPPDQQVWIPFSMDDSAKEVVTARGRSKELYKLFTQKKEREDFREEPPLKFPSEVPVNAVWVKQHTGSSKLASARKDAENAWNHNLVPYKCFYSAEELRKIIQLFDEPEYNGITPGFAGDESLVIWYIPPKEPVLLSFSVDDSNKEILTAKGKSKELHKLLTEKEERTYNSMAYRMRKKNKEQNELPDKELLCSPQGQPSAGDSNLTGSIKPEEK